MFYFDGIPCKHQPFFSFSGFIPTKNITYNTYTYTDWHFIYFRFSFKAATILTSLEMYFWTVDIFFVHLFVHYLDVIWPTSNNLPTHWVHFGNISVIFKARRSIHLHLTNTLWSYPMKKTSHFPTSTRLSYFLHTINQRNFKTQ